MSSLLFKFFRCLLQNLESPDFVNYICQMLNDMIDMLVPFELIRIRQQSSFFFNNDTGVY